MCCHGKKIFVSSGDSKLSYDKSVLLYDRTPLTGSVFILDKSDTVGIDIFENGLQQGRSIRLLNHRVIEERWYQQGNRVGIHRGWYANGNLKFQYDYDNDMMHGEARDWYVNGKPYKLMHYEKGYEAGMQTMWKRDGKLAMNYFARDGRNYGLTGVKSCENLWDSVRSH